MTDSPSQPGRRSAVIVGVTLATIALVAVWSARHPPRPTPQDVPQSDLPRPAVVEPDPKAAHRLACDTINRTVDAALVFDLRFTIEDAGDGTSLLTTAALLNGQRVDVSAVLQWDAERQAWDLLEARLGGAAVVGWRRE
jgi:hypothetical protein